MLSPFLYLSMIALGLLVVIHELGHMLVARYFGIRAEEVSIGFGPAIATFSGRRREGDAEAGSGSESEPTQYRIRLIPLGGYVKFRGMEEDPIIGGGSSEEEEQRRSERSSERSPDPHSYREKSVGKRMAVIAAGPAANALVAVLLLTGVYMAGVPQSINEVDTVKDGSPAAEAGLRSGDRITSVGGEPVGSWSEVESALADSGSGDSQGPGAGIPVTFAAGEDAPERSGTLALPEGEGGGSLERLAGGGAAASLGLEPATDVQGSAPHTAFAQAVVSCVVVTALMGVVVVGLILGTFGLQEALIGPIGVVSVTGDAPSLVTFVFLIAIISLDLAVFNILPIPPLDGGHLAFSAIEKVRGKPVSPKVAALATNFGIALMITTVIFITFSDISKILRGVPLLGGIGG